MWLGYELRYLKVLEFLYSSISTSYICVAQSGKFKVCGCQIFLLHTHSLSQTCTKLLMLWEGRSPREKPLRLKHYINFKENMLALQSSEKFVKEGAERL